MTPEEKEAVMRPIWRLRFWLFWDELAALSVALFTPWVRR